MAQSSFLAHHFRIHLLLHCMCVRPTCPLHTNICLLQISCSLPHQPCLDMPSQPGNAPTFRVGSASSSSSSSISPPTRKVPNRKFFHNVQPAFAVSRPSARQLKFIDDADPKKNVVVRKNAREWVHRNKQSVLDIRTESPAEGKGRSKHEVDKIMETRRKNKSASWRVVLTPDSLLDIAASKPDPFDVFPVVGRKIDHIIEYCEYRLLFLFLQTPMRRVHRSRDSGQIYPA